MAYREVTMLEIKEVLRLWLGGAAHKRIAAQLGLNVKTVRRYVAAARASGGNRGPDEWLATFADPIRAQGAIDRFPSSAYDLIIEGESYRTRLKPSLKATATSRKATGTHG